MYGFRDNQLVDYIQPRIYLIMQETKLSNMNVEMQVQDQELQRRNGDWRHSYYTPASADAAVTALRRWFSTTGSPSYCCL